MAGTSVGSVHCTCPAIAPVAGLRMVPVPENSVLLGAVSGGLMAVIRAMVDAAV